MTRNKTFNFENTLANLTSLANDLESGEQSLEESLKNFEEGIGLTRQAQKAIEAAEQKVQLLLQEGDDASNPVARHITEENEIGK